MMIQRYEQKQAFRNSLRQQSTTHELSSPSFAAAFQTLSQNSHSLELFLQIQKNYNEALLQSLLSESFNEVEFIELKKQQQAEFQSLCFNMFQHLEATSSSARNTPSVPPTDLIMATTVPKEKAVDEHLTSKNNSKEEDDSKSAKSMAISINSFSLDSLLHLGFEEKKARFALQMTQGNVDDATILLTDYADTLDASMMQLSRYRRPSTPSTPTRKLDQSSASSSTKTSNASTLLTFRKLQNLLVSKTKSLAQQLTSPSPSAAISPAASASVSATATVAASHNRSHTGTELPLSESFTCTIGSQIKLTQNVRLAVFDIYRHFFPLAVESTDHELAANAQILSTLYSSNLWAVVLPIKLSDVQHYGQSFSPSCNRAFFECCKRFAELHFPQISDQLSSQFINAREWSVGDVIITKHSNLPHCHLVFHVIIPDSCRQSLSTTINGPELTLLANSIKTLIRWTFTYNILNLTIPLSILSLSSSSSENEENCVKSAEILVKTIKSSLNENSRTFRGNNRGIRTLTLAAPSYTSQETFKAMRSIIATYFKAI